MATAQFYDRNKIDSLLSGKVSKAGDTMTGPLNFGNAFLDPSDGTICYVDGESGGTLIKLEEMSLWDPSSGSASAKRWTMEVTRDGTPGYEDIATLDDIAELAAVATSGSYNDLTDKPTIPAAQIQSDWDQTDSSAKDFIKNKPTIPTSFDRIVSQDGDTSVVVNNGTATLKVEGATIGDNDPLSDLADYLGLGDNATLDDVRQALGLSVNATLEDAVEAVPASSDKTIATLDDLEPKLDTDQRNLLPYASGTTLALGTAVYRSVLNSDGTFPTITDSGIPTASAYYQFELEMTVPSTVPSTIYGPTMGGAAFDSTASYAVGDYVVYDNVEYVCVTAHTGAWDASHFRQAWVFIAGHGLPDPADLSGGETICISVRLDCTARTFLASVWRVA